MTMHAAKGLEFDHVFVLGPVRRRACPGPSGRRPATCPTSCSRSGWTSSSPRAEHEAEMRRLLHVAMTRARKGLVLAWARDRAARHHAAPVALLRGGARGAGARGGDVRGGAVRPGRGPALDVPDHARRAARHRRARGRAARRDAARHLPRRRPGHGALPRADQGRGADRARARGPAARDRAARGERDPGPVRHARAARDLRGVGARRLAARHRPRPGRAARVDATAPTPRSTRSSRAAGAG